MTNGTILLAALLASFFALKQPCFGAENNAPVNSPKNSKFLAAQNSQAALSVPAKIMVVPFFSAGQSVTLTVIDLAGNPSSGAAVFVNDDLRTTDANGAVTFTAPDSDNLELSLQSEDHLRVDRRKFRRMAEGIFAESEIVAEEAAALLKISNNKVKYPTLTFAPAVVAPGDNFVVVGSNFSTNPAEDKVEIDNADAPVVSASPDALLVLAPNKLKIGPVREIVVSVDGQISNICETDVARTFFNHVKTEEDDVSPEKGKIGMNGTNVPCLISVRNPDLEAASLWSPEPLGKYNVLLTPGGDQNYLSLDVKLVRPDLEPQLQINLRSELDYSADAEKIPPQLKVAACRAQIVRLERRRIAAEYRIQELRKKLSEDSPEQERLMNETHALSLRMQRLSTMLLARRAFYESLGGTDAQYRQALDDAAGGAGVSLDLAVKQVQIIPGPDERTVVNLIGKKGRKLSSLEPRIKLLPPMTEAELKFAAAMREAQVDGNAPLTGPDGLRPSLPEAAPQVSDDSRSTSTGTVIPAQKQNFSPKVPPVKAPAVKAPSAKSKSGTKKGNPVSSNSSRSKKSARNKIAAPRSRASKKQSIAPIKAKTKRRRRH